MTSTQEPATVRTRRRVETAAWVGVFGAEMACSAALTVVWREKLFLYPLAAATCWFCVALWDQHLIGRR